MNIDIDSVYTYRPNTNTNTYIPRKYKSFPTVITVGLAPLPKKLATDTVGWLPGGIDSRDP